MRYTVIEAFCDMQDGDREYAPGDAYPKYEGIADSARLAELASSNNKLGRPLIKAIEPVEKVKTEPIPERSTAEVKPGRKKSVK